MQHLCKHKYNLCKTLNNQFNEMKSELNAYEKILKDTTLLSRYKIKGVERYCVVHDFPEPTCDSLQVVAYDPLQKSTAQDRLMNLCKDVN